MELVDGDILVRRNLVECVTQTVFEMDSFDADMLLVLLNKIGK